MKMPFGKFAGIDLGDLPDGYLGWLHGRDLYEPLRSAVNAEFQERAAAPPEDESPQLYDDVQALAAEMISVGYRALAARHHPDHGGNTYAMQLVNLARDYLRQVLRGGRG